MTVVVPPPLDAERADLWPVHDLGGLDAASGRTRPGLVFRAPSVSDLSEDARQRLRRLPLACRIDLRASFELREAPQPDFGERVVDVVHVPLLDTLSASAYRELVDAAVRDGGLPALYRLMATRSAAAIAAAFGAVAANATRGLASVVHCTAGRDRSGVVTAVLLAAVGVRQGAIAAQQAVFCPAPADATVDLRNLPTAPSPIEELLAFLTTEWGGATAYLQGHGVPAASIAAFRRAFVSCS